MAERHCNPLHGLTLQNILQQLVSQLGWEAMAAEVAINCFSHEPSIKSNLKFLRKTPWTREQVENLYLHRIARQTLAESAAPQSHQTTTPQAVTRRL